MAHASNPNKPQEPTSFPTPIVENGRSIFNNGTFDHV
jgi:hypothetical protein